MDSEVIAAGRGLVEQRWRWKGALVPIAQDLVQWIPEIIERPRHLQSCPQSVRERPEDEVGTDQPDFVAGVAWAINDVSYSFPRNERDDQSEPNTSTIEAHSPKQLLSGTTAWRFSRDQVNDTLPASSKSRHFC